MCFSKIGYHYFSILTLLLIVTTWSSCANKYQFIDSFEEESIFDKDQKFDEARSWPNTSLEYIEKRQFKVHFHFFDNVDSTLNFKKEGAIEMVATLLKEANRRLQVNDKMNLPVGNDTNVYDAKIHYVLDSLDGKPALFFHRERDVAYFIKNGKKANRYNRKVIYNYATNRGKVLNIFIMPFDPKQLENGEQKIERTAIALGTTIKIPGMYQAKRSPKDYAGMLNHELGHVLGLRHTWQSNDYCNDTPKHDNCWNTNQDPPCDGATSNNMMDYNAFQSAITPCQLRIMHASIADPGAIGGRIFEKNWCEKKIDKTIRIYNKERWKEPMLLSGDLIIEKGGQLFISNMVHVPKGAIIEIKKGGVLFLENATFYNSCKDTWLGIKCHAKGKLILLGPNNLIQNTMKESLG